MTATAIETAKQTEQIEETPAQGEFHRCMACWVNSGQPDHALDAVQGLASAAFDRAEEVHTEHDRMILDLQGCVRDLTEGKLGGDRIESVEYAIYLQSEHIRELQSTIEDLIAVGVNPTTKTPVRARVNFTPPTKERGWNHEATVEPVYPDAADVDWDAIVAAQAEAYEKCEAEAIRRDRLEGRERRYFA